MRAVADDKSLGGGPEDRLTAEFARYLFDQGLSPLSKPMAGGLQPDLLDPAARFYVEGKAIRTQTRGATSSRRSPRSWTPVGGAWSGASTRSKKRSASSSVVAARTTTCPHTLRTHSYRLNLVLVDLAPPDEAGSVANAKSQPS